MEEKEEERKPPQQASRGQCMNLVHKPHELFALRQSRMIVLPSKSYDNDVYFLKD